MSEPTENVPQTAESVDADVERVALTHTGDGFGDEDPGPSDFQAFAAPPNEVEMRGEDE